MKCLLLIAALAVAARAQIPSLGFCPEYLPMPGFDMDRFAGIWHEAERYFQLTEVASRCVTSNYTKAGSGKYFVINEVMSRFTGVTRVLKGEIRRPLKGEEGKLNVKYSTVPLIPLETQYNVLETDYENYAVLWSCTGVGPVHTQNAWIMTRQRLAPGDIMQKAYAVLDKYKISKVFFVKTNQDDCAYLEESQNQTKPPTKVTTEPPKKAEESAVVEEISNESEESPEPLAGKSAGEIRPHIVPDAPEAIIQTRKAEIEAKEKIAEVVEPVKAATIQQPIVESLQADEAVRSVPEVIMKIADQAKPVQQEVEIPVLKAVDELVKESPIQEEIKDQKKIDEAASVLAEALEIVKVKPLAEESTDALVPEPAISEPVKEAAPLDTEAAVAAPAVVEAEVKEPEVQPLKKPEPIVEEKIEIVEP